jgi:hypothetical protein
MLKKVRLDSEEQLIRVQFCSYSTVEDWKSSLVLVRRLSEETGIRRVLIDVREQTNLADTMELFHFATNLPKSIAFAVLCEIYIEDHRFIENVAKSRSIAVKDFSSEQDAIEWLKNWPNKIMDHDRQ